MWVVRGYNHARADRHRLMEHAMSGKLQHFRCWCLTAIVLAGCTSEQHAPLTQAPENPENGLKWPAEDAPNTQPATLEDAIRVVLAAHTAIRTAFEAHDDEAAHGPLHQIGAQLARVAELSSGLHDAQRHRVQIAVVKLTNAFDSVDAALHGRNGPHYQDVFLDIEDNVIVLQQVCDQLGHSISP